MPEEQTPSATKTIKLCVVTVTSHVNRCTNHPPPPPVHPTQPKYILNYGPKARIPTPPVVREFLEQTPKHSREGKLWLCKGNISGYIGEKNPKHMQLETPNEPSPFNKPG